MPRTAGARIVLLIKDEVDHIEALTSATGYDSVAIAAMGPGVHKEQLVGEACRRGGRRCSGSTDVLLMEGAKRLLAECRQRERHGRQRLLKLSRGDHRGSKAKLSSLQGLGMMAKNRSGVRSSSRRPCSDQGAGLKQPWWRGCVLAATSTVMSPTRCTKRVYENLFFTGIDSNIP